MPMSIGDPAQSAEAAHCPQVPPELGGRAMGWASDPHTAVQAPQPEMGASRSSPEPLPGSVHTRTSSASRECPGCAVRTPVAPRAGLT